MYSQVKDAEQLAQGLFILLKDCSFERAATKLFYAILFLH